jgi:hypothetical protein
MVTWPSVSVTQSPDIATFESRRVDDHRSERRWGDCAGNVTIAGETAWTKTSASVTARRSFRERNAWYVLGVPEDALSRHGTPGGRITVEQRLVSSAGGRRWRVGVAGRLARARGPAEDAAGGDRGRRRRRATDRRLRRPRPRRRDRGKRPGIWKSRAAACVPGDDQTRQQRREDAHGESEDRRPQADASIVWAAGPRPAGAPDTPDRPERPDSSREAVVDRRAG